MTNAGTRGRPAVAFALLLALAAAVPAPLAAQGTRLLRQPTVSATQVAFEYGGDLWIVGRNGGEATRLTSTAAIETDPHFSPDGQWIAFTSDRTGTPQVWVVSAQGGEPRRLTWHPSPSFARGWTPDGKSVLYASERGSAPVPYAHLWVVPLSGGAPRQIPEAMAMRGSYSPDGRQLVVDRVDRWDVEFRNYRGGQNTPLTIVDLSGWTSDVGNAKAAPGAGAAAELGETMLPNDHTTDIYPVWQGGKIFFISDRDYAENVWSYDVATKQLAQVTHFKDDVKTLDGSAPNGANGANGANALAFEQGGGIWLLDPGTGQSHELTVTVHGDFPWAESHWQDVSDQIASASLSPTGKRALFEARGDIFTVPAEKGDVRNLTHTPGAADRSPLWSPDGRQIAWLSDEGAGYRLLVADEDGLKPPRVIPLGDETKFAWSMTWSPDGKHMAWVDQRARIQVLELASGKITTADVDGSILGREDIALAWSPDSKWLAYAKVYPNAFRRIVVWSLESGKVTPLTDGLADARSPRWDMGGRWLYFLASTNLGLGSAWANLSAAQARPTYGVYVALLRKEDPTPFVPQSDDEPGDTSKTAATAPAKAPAKADAAPAAKPAADVRIDTAGIGRRLVALPLPARAYDAIHVGPAGVLFVGERIENQPGATVHRFDMQKRKDEVFASGVREFAVSRDGKRALLAQGPPNNPSWSIVGTEAPAKPGDGKINVALRRLSEPQEEWKQIYEDAWRIERDFFYAPNLHGADWNAVHARYAPLVPYVKSREDLRYILDMLGGELSVGHSFTGGGDYPAVDSVHTGLLGADFTAEGGRWKISRILEAESWNPGLHAPLAEPGVRAAEGDYLLAVNGHELTADEDPYHALDGTAEQQTSLTLNDKPAMDGAWTITVVPVRDETPLRQRAWIEDNRRRVDALSHGRLAYVWLPNTAGSGFASFNRYFFSQQDREGAVVDERFNGGGALDDYYVDMMGRKLMGGITNDVATGGSIRIPTAGILGPKVLLVNERAGSGGDYFPWAFRQLRIGPLVGARTWGGLVAACSPYPLVDGGFITSPCSAVFSGDHWVAENEGVPPDIDVYYDARDWAAGRDPQLERAVAEAMKLLETEGVKAPVHPPYPVKAKRPEK